jgi:hypothetical protein
LGKRSAEPAQKSVGEKTAAYDGRGAGEYFGLEKGLVPDSKDLKKDKERVSVYPAPRFQIYGPPDTQQIKAYWIDWEDTYGSEQHTSLGQKGLYGLRRLL